MKILMHKAGVQSSPPATSGARRIAALSARRLCAIAAAAVMLFPQASAASEIILTYKNVDAPARAVVDAAIGFWEALLFDPLTFTITIEGVYLGGALASSSNFTEVGGRPISGRITIDDGSGGIPWFVDDSPDDDLEFRRRHPFHVVADRNGPAAGAFDLLTVIHHELAHVLGFSVFYPAFAAHLVDTPDGNRAYVGPTATVPLTGAGAGTHVLPEAQPFDLMNPELQPGHRLYPSPLDLAVLRDAFGYSFSSVPPVEPVPEPPAAIGLALAVLAAAARRLIR